MEASADYGPRLHAAGSDRTRGLGNGQAVGVHRVVTLSSTSGQLRAALAVPSRVSPLAVDAIIAASEIAVVVAPCEPRVHVRSTALASTVTADEPDAFNFRGGCMAGHWREWLSALAGQLKRRSKFPAATAAKTVQRERGQPRSGAGSFASRLDLDGPSSKRKQCQQQLDAGVITIKRPARDHSPA